MNKRGAMELSINTIIIIVIGVALLSVGLLFLGNIKDKLFNMGNEAFRTGSDALRDLNNFDSKLSVSSSIDVKKGDATPFQIIIGNDKNVERTFTIDVKPAASNDAGTKLKMIVPITEFKIAGGAGKELTVNVRADKNIVVDSYAYLVNVKADGQDYESAEFFVNIKT